MQNYITRTDSFEQSWRDYRRLIRIVDEAGNHYNWMSSLRVLRKGLSCAPALDEIMRALTQYPNGITTGAMAKLLSKPISLVGTQMLSLLRRHDEGENLVMRRLESLPRGGRTSYYYLSDLGQAVMSCNGEE